MKNNLIFCLSLLLGIYAEAKTLIISDIDDTIKISHVRSLEKVINSVDLLQEFSGMSELYNTMISDIDTNPDGVEIAYVSNAPFIVMSIPHAAFLDLNNFPQGQLLLRDSIFAENQKIPIITKLISEQRPDRVIMIGDNGEIDSEVYFKIESLFANKGIKFHSFIHQVYSTQSEQEKGNPLLKGQNGFVTSLDLAVSLHHAGLLTYAKFLEFWNKNARDVISEKEGLIQSKVIPYWIGCSDYFKEKNLSANFLGAELTEFLSEKCQ